MQISAYEQSIINSLNREQASEALRSDEGDHKERGHKFLAVIGAVAAIGAGALMLNDQKVSAEKAMEACVSKQVGYPVDLVTNPETDMIQRPASVLQEMRNC